MLGAATKIIGESRLGKVLAGYVSLDVIHVTMAHQCVEQKLGIFPALIWDPGLLLHCGVAL
jgi:hypothetical protein